MPARKMSIPSQSYIVGLPLSKRPQCRGEHSALTLVRIYKIHLHGWDLVSLKEPRLVYILDVEYVVQVKAPAKKNNEVDMV